MADDFDIDVLVIGTGAAGLSAALQASDDPDLSVVLVDSEDHVGGASAWSTGIVMAAGTEFQAAEGISDTAEELAREYQVLNNWEVLPAIANRLAYDSGPTISWLVGLGAKCTGIIFAGDERVPRAHVFEGLGANIVDVLFAEVKRRRNVDVVLKTRVTELLRDDAGRVVGALAGDEEMRSRATILATGGFGANRMLLKEHFPRAHAADDWLWYVGPPSSRGDGLVMAAHAGADITGHDNGVLRLRANFTHENEGAYLPGWMVVVNSQGRRYMDEMSPYNVAEAVTSAQSGPVFALWDDRTKREAQPGTTAQHRKVNFPEGHPWEDFVEPVIDEMVETGKVHVAQSIPELADKLGIPAPALTATLETYNADCHCGRDRFFDKQAPVFKTVATRPFYATELRLWHMPLTAVGPQIDADARVLDRHWNAIPGLYAAGEVTGGVVGKHYVGSGNAYANALVFGRRAGQTAASDLT
ncbi:FAD-dependent oxidoreductase [Rhodococcus sp. T2V]|uniref:FAD-dependent oxidoreductase n=1 Tax=Rhodococcus sp. T2V TaxID=3034164 RepID=UPI0023E2F607|nr:FAD-dependent oxidoreductase [Rhodococcus sp. T2V]MDF3309570.1 FAD-dependent oxidoreductase [Rhodococcus sp. T2V]